MPIFSGEYPQKNTPVDDDKVLIADSENLNAIKGTRISSIVAKAVTAGVSAVNALTDWITTVMIKDGAVTSEKIAHATIGQAAGARAMNATTIVISGLGFKPRRVDFFFMAGTATNGVYNSQGVSLANGSHYSNATYTNGSSHRRTSEMNDSILLTNATVNLVRGKVTAWGDDGFTITLANVGGGGDIFAWVASE